MVIYNFLFYFFVFFSVQNGRPPFNSETSRNLLMCLVWVLRWAEKGALAVAIAELPPARLHCFLALIDLCFKCQEYKVGFTCMWEYIAG